MDVYTDKFIPITGSVVMEAQINELQVVLLHRSWHNRKILSNRLIPAVVCVLMIHIFFNGVIMEVASSVIMFHMLRFGGGL